MNNVTFSNRSPLGAIAAGVALSLSLSGCSSLNEMMGGDKVDYRGSAATRARALEVPPDLSQLNADSRYQVPAGRSSISASEFQNAAAPVNPSAQAVAPANAGDIRIVRLRDQRFIATPQAPEQVWPMLLAFWEERSLALVVNKPEVGVMETEWAENRALLPAGFVRRTLGKVAPVLMSSNTLDKFRLRVERSPDGKGSEIFLTHSGLEENYSGAMKETLVWEPRARDYQVEAELLSLLMLKLGATAEASKPAAIAAVTTGNEPTRARVVAGQPAATAQIDDGFDRAWRRVGLALDRSGFTIEDRDRAQGIYFVRYVDPDRTGREEPGFLARWFGGAKKSDPSDSLVRYRVQLKSEAEVTTVTVQDAAGAPESGSAGQRIVKAIVDDLK